MVIDDGYFVRLTVESKELEERIRKLTEFIHGPGFQILAYRDQKLLKDQADAMKVYSDILKERLEII